jgi:hypothetical protein
MFAVQLATHHAHLAYASKDVVMQLDFVGLVTVELLDVCAQKVVKVAYLSVQPHLLFIAALLLTASVVTERTYQTNAVLSVTTAQVCGSAALTVET